MAKIKTNYFFYIIIIFIFIVINVMIFFLSAGYTKNNKLFLQYVSEQMLSNLLEAVRNENISEYLKADKNILAFGIYDENGENTLSYGNIPKKLEINNDIRKNIFFDINLLKNTVTLIRPFGIMQMQDNMRNFHSRGLIPNRILKIAYIQFGTKKYIQTNFPSGIRFPLMSFFSVCVLAVFIFLYKKTEKYKDKYEKQSHLAQLGEASRTIVHEIKNPLSSIKLNTAYLKKKFPAECSEEIKNINDDVERIKNTIDRVRDFLKDPLGSPEKIDINEFLKDLILKYENKIIYNNKLDNKFSIKIDPEKLRSVIENIINNAIESFVENTEEKKIELELKKEKNMILISVMDRGKGLDKGHEENIFDPFYTTKYQGFGIGLSLVKRYTEAAGGNVTISPREGGGTEVKLYFKIED